MLSSELFPTVQIHPTKRLEETVTLKRPSQKSRWHNCTRVQSAGNFWPPDTETEPFGQTDHSYFEVCELKSSILIAKHRGGCVMLGRYFSATGSPELHKIDGPRWMWGLMWGLMTLIVHSVSLIWRQRQSPRCAGTCRDGCRSSSAAWWCSLTSSLLLCPRESEIIERIEMRHRLKTLQPFAQMWSM